MKFKSIQSPSLKVARAYCPNCHREILMPKFIGQIKSENGIRLLCGNCKNGKVKIVIPKEEQDVIRN